ncbi:MAG: lysylphosphatidylglycerol synthase transmembrane domain-containing protein [Acidimicrobiales bacterium]
MAAPLQTAGKGHIWKIAIRYILGIAIGVVVLLLLFGKRGELLGAWHQLGHVRVTWVAAAVVAEALSTTAYAILQHRVLRLSGSGARLSSLSVITLGNNAIANSVPGQPAVSSAYRYRHYRRLGASGASAGWTVFTVVIAQALGMSLLLLLGVAIALVASSGSKDTGIAVVGLLVVAAGAGLLIRRDLLLRFAALLVRACQRVTGRPRTGMGARIEATLARMREIPLAARSSVGIVAIGASVWAFDFACLLCAFAAVRAHIPWQGVLLAYGVAQVVGSLPIVPGGIGVVEGSLAVVLVAYGTARVAALSATLVYRIISFWLAIAVGWVCIGVIAHRARREEEPVVQLPAPGLQPVGALPPE